jgi:hypothetical protein
LDSVNDDSITRARVDASIAKKLNAKKFDFFNTKRYSISYDSLKNIRLYSDDYAINDIVKSDSGYIIKVTGEAITNSLVSLSATEAEVKTLTENADRKPTIVFTITRALKINVSISTDESQNVKIGIDAFNTFPKFNIEGQLLSVEAL